MENSGKTPWHIWGVGIVSLLWNAVGANDYLQTQMRNMDYIKAAVEPMGLDIQTAMAYFDSFPVWADAAWALGVWGSVLGSLLILFRSRFAFHAFAVSLVGLAITTFFQYGNPMPGEYDKTIPIVFSIVIWVIILALIYYTRRQTAAGVLR